MPMLPASPINVVPAAPARRRGVLLSVAVGAAALLLLPGVGLAQPAPAGQKVSGAALFDALTHAGPPGLAEELRSIAALLDRGAALPAGGPAGSASPLSQATNLSHAAAEASRRLANAAARLEQADASPTLVLANMADRLDAAMNSLAASNHPPDAVPPQLFLLACAFSIGAAALGLGAMLISRRTRPAPASNLVPTWANGLPDRIAEVVREAATITLPPMSPHTTQAMEAAIATGQHLAGVARDAEARLEAATRRAEGALDDFYAADLAQQRVDGAIGRLEEQLAQAFGRLLGEGAEQLASVASRLDGAAAPIGALSAHVEQAAFRLDHAGERLDEAIPALGALLDGTLPAAVRQITALGEKLDGQTATADAASRWLAYVAEISARLEATTEALAGAGAGLPARVEHAAGVLQAAAFRAAAAVVGEAERAAEIWQGSAGPLIQQMGETTHQVSQSGRMLEAVTLRLESSGEALSGLSRMLPARAEQTAGLLAAASERAVATVVGEVERAAAAWSRRAAPIAQHMSEASEQVSQAGQALQAVAARLEAAGAALADMGAALPDRTAHAVSLLESAADRLAAIAAEEAEHTAARAEQTAEAFATAADRAKAILAGEAERAAVQSGQVAAALQAAADRTLIEADRAAATWHESADAVAAQMQAAGHQAAQAGRALEAVLARLAATGEAVEAATAALPAHLDRAAEGLLAHAGTVSETISAGLAQATGAFVDTAGSTVQLLSQIGEQLLRTGQQVEALGSRVGDGCEDRLQQLGEGLEARVDAAGVEVARVIALLAQDLERQARAAAYSADQWPPAAVLLAGPDGTVSQRSEGAEPNGEITSGENTSVPAGLAQQAPDLLAGVQATVGRLHFVAAALAEACDRQAAPNRRRAR